MGTVASLIFGAGLVSLWLSWWAPSTPSPTPNRLTLRIRDRLNQAGMHGVHIGPFVFLSLALGSVIWVTVLGLTTSFAIATALAIASCLVPSWYVRRAARKRRTVISNLWPEAIDDLISAIRAGMALPEALGALGVRGPHAMRHYFMEFAYDYQATGRFDECLNRLKERLADPGADRIIEALRITQTVGGTDLTRMLTTLAHFLRKDLRTRKELIARQSWTTAGAKLATAAPWIVLALLSTRAETAEAFDTALGVMVLAIGAVVSILAYSLMIALGRLPEEQRVLR